MLKKCRIGIQCFLIRYNGIISVCTIDLCFHHVTNMLHELLWTAYHRRCTQVYRHLITKCISQIKVIKVSYSMMVCVYMYVCILEFTKHELPSLSLHLQTNMIFHHIRMSSLNELDVHTFHQMAFKSLDIFCFIWSISLSLSLYSNMFFNTLERCIIKSITTNTSSIIISLTLITLIATHIEKHKLFSLELMSHGGKFSRIKMNTYFPRKNKFRIKSTPNESSS